MTTLRNEKYQCVYVPERDDEVSAFFKKFYLVRKK